jgi:hypothetical protein
MIEPVVETVASLKSTPSTIVIVFACAGCRDAAAANANPAKARFNNDLLRFMGISPYHKESQ